MDKASYWKAHSEAQRVSGQTIEEYCAHHHLNSHSLSYWRKKLREPQEVRSVDKSAGVKASSFVKLIGARSEGARLRESTRPVGRLTLKGGLVLECFEWPDGEWLHRLGALP